MQVRSGADIGYAAGFPAVRQNEKIIRRVRAKHVPAGFNQADRDQRARVLRVRGLRVHSRCFILSGKASSVAAA
jgi:hypothetical protein